MKTKKTKNLCPRFCPGRRDLLFTFYCNVFGVDLDSDYSEKKKRYNVYRCKQCMETYKGDDK